jgi:hypothetical protein
MHVRVHLCLAFYSLRHTAEYKSAARCTTEGAGLENFDTIRS